MKKIILLNEKGGQSKTTMSATLGTELAARGLRTLLLDGDSQGHLSLLTRTRREDRLYMFLNDRAPIRDVVVPVQVEYYGGDADNPTLFIIPSAEGTALLDKMKDVYELHNRLPELEPYFDVVIMDTSPKIGQLHIAGYIFADYLIYPTACTYLPIQGLFASLAHYKKATEQGYPVGQIMGILPTFYDKRRVLQKQNYEHLMTDTALRKRYGELHVFSPVKPLDAWEKASALRTPITRLPFENDAAKEAIRFVNEVLQRMGVMENV